MEEPDKEEGEMATFGEQQNEEGHTAVAAKRRMAQPTKKARNMATSDKEPEFLDEPSSPTRPATGMDERM